MTGIRCVAYSIAWIVGIGIVALAYPKFVYKQRSAPLVRAA